MHPCGRRFEASWVREKVSQRLPKNVTWGLIFRAQIELGFRARFEHGKSNLWGAFSKDSLIPVQKQTPLGLIFRAQIQLGIRARFQLVFQPHWIAFGATGRPVFRIPNG